MSSNLTNKWKESGGFLRRKDLYPVILVILAIILLIQTIRLMWLIVTPLGPVGEWRAREVQTLSAQSRVALFTNFDPFFRNGPVATGNVVTSLQLTLYGIRMNLGSGLGSAILAGADGVQDSFAVGDEIMPGVTLDSVQFDHVIIDRGGVKESLYIDQSVPAETIAPIEPAITAINPPIETGTSTEASDKPEKTKSEPAAAPESDEAS